MAIGSGIESVSTVPERRLGVFIHDDVERRSQIVAHDRQELVAGEGMVVGVGPPDLLLDEKDERMLDGTVRVLALADQVPIGTLAPGGYATSRAPCVPTARFVASWLVAFVTCVTFVADCLRGLRG